MPARAPAWPCVACLAACASLLLWHAPGEARESRRRTLSIEEAQDARLASTRKRAARQPAAPSPESRARLRALRQAARDPRRLMWRGQAVDPLEQIPAMPTLGPYNLTAAAYPAKGRRCYIVQFAEAIRPEWLSALRQAGAEVVDYLPNNAYFVRIDRRWRGRLQGMPRVRWIGELRPGDKIDPALARMMSASPGAEEVRLRVATFRGASARPLRSLVSRTDPSCRVRGLREGPLGRGRLLLSAKAAALPRLVAALARHPDVAWIEADHPLEFLNDQSAWVIQSGHRVSEATPIWRHGITGLGQIYGAADSGIDTDACQMRFSASPQAQTLFNITQPPFVHLTHPGNKILAYYVIGSAQPYDDSDSDFHGTHTTGNAVGDDFATLATGAAAGHDPGDGMAPAATVVFQDIGRHDGAIDLGSGQADLQQQAHDSGARVHNNSYGVPAAFVEDPNAYDLDSQELDEAMWRLRHYTIVFAAGNDGPVPGSLGLGGSTAKNPIAVGATLSGRDGAEELAGFSSHGPTSDGRIKPDLVAPGDAIVSATEDPGVVGPSQTDPPNNNCATSAASGTSFAAPTVAGAALLARQYFTDGFYPSGARAPADAFEPSSALVKAALINSARNLAGQFSASDGTGGASGARPNFGQGWGRVTLDDALFFPGDLRELRVLNDVLNGATTVISPAATSAIQTGEVHEFTLEQVSPIEELRVTLNWSDPPGPTGAGVVLVNDLDLEVLIGGVLYRGNVNFVDGSSTPAGPAPADRLNTTESVIIPAPPPGPCTIRVRGANVPGNGVMSPFPSNRQGYALIATGNFSYGTQPLVRFESAQISGGKGDDAFLDRTEALDVAVAVRNAGASEALGATVALRVDARSEVSASAVVISPLSISYGIIPPGANATERFSIALLDDGLDHGQQRLVLRVDSGASGAVATNEVFAIETMADTSTIPLFNGFEAGLPGWTLLPPAESPSPRPGLVTCEASGDRPTPLTELKFGAPDCASPYANDLIQVAFSPSFVVPLADNARLVSVEFWHRVGTEPFFDFADLFLDHDNDGMFDFVTDFHGPDTGRMRPFRAGLDERFNIGRTERLALALQLETDQSATAFPGWFVDDLSITTQSDDPVADMTPTLIAVSLATAMVGSPSLDVAVTGLQTHFAQGVSIASVSGTGVTVNSTTVDGPTHATINVTIGAGAELGLRALTMTTGSEVASRAILFRVVPSSLSVEVTPADWRVGIVAPGSSVTTWTAARPPGGGRFSARNDGQMTEALSISVEGSAAWVPGSSPGADRFVVRWGRTAAPGVPPAFAMITPVGVPLVGSLAVDETFRFDLQLDTPTSTSDFAEQQITATIAAESP